MIGCSSTDDSITIDNLESINDKYNFSFGESPEIDDIDSVISQYNTILHQSTNDKMKAFIKFNTEMFKGEKNFILSKQKGGIIDKDYCSHINDYKDSLSFLKSGNNNMDLAIINFDVFINDGFFNNLGFNKTLYNTIKESSKQNNYLEGQIKVIISKC